MTLEQSIREFLEYLEVERGRARRTTDNYQFYLHRFDGWADEHGIRDPESITQESVRQYRLWLNRFQDRAGEDLKKNTQNYHLIALRAFLKYLAKRDIKTMAAEKIELQKMPVRQVEFLESEDLERLLKAPLEYKNIETQENKSAILALRDKAILEMFFSTGLRVSELAGLKRGEINPSKEEFTVRGKGSKLRVVFMSHEARGWLKKYLDARRDTSMHLFVRHDRAAGARKNIKIKEPKNKNRDDSEGALTPRSIQRIVEKYARAAGITKQISPHTMRHTFATDLLRNGADIRSVQTLLGHSSITTTQIYTHITDTQLREIHKTFHGKKREG